MSGARVNPGDVLGGKYKVERVLGAGGMGVVVAARHIELGQRVALKFMLKEAMSDPAQAERFIREARASVQLQSVHTARVLDVGKLKNGEPFMVMEYLDGKDLDEVLRLHGPLAPHVACAYLLQAAEALAEAHGLGMIHRDVKLKNIFLTATLDGRPLVKVLDFGLAKQIGVGGDVSLTATSSVFGSPQYMSPEQMRSARDVDTRTDIWSLGVCLYELLTGRLPFDAAGVAEICAMVLKDPVPPPSRFARGLSEDLEKVVLRCLEKDVKARFQSVADLAFALESHAAEEGSARRILQVLQTAQKTDVPTVISSPALPPEEPRGKTLAAFSSVADVRVSRSPWILYAALGTLAGLLLLAVVAGLLYRRAEAASDASAARTPEPAVAGSPSLPIGAEPSASAAAAFVTAAMATSAAPQPPPTVSARASKPIARPAATAAPRPPPATRPTAGAAPKPTSTNPGDRF